MSYAAKTNWVNDQTVLPADINRMEQGIKDVTDADALKAPINNPTFTGEVIVPVPVNAGDAAQLKNITDLTNQALKTTSTPTFAGLTATGPVTVQAPSAAKSPATKEYVDALTDQSTKAASTPTFAGMTLTGPATVQAPSAAKSPATKEYVDANVNQPVKSTSSPTFSSATITNTLTADKVIGAVYQ